MSTPSTHNTILIDFVHYCWLTFFMLAEDPDELSDSLKGFIETLRDRHGTTLYQTTHCQRDGRLLVPLIVSTTCLSGRVFVAWVV